MSKCPDCSETDAEPERPYKCDECGDFHPEVAL